MKHHVSRVLAFLLAVLCASCIRPNPIQPARISIRVAAAANLTGVLQELNRAFEQNTQMEVISSSGSTAQLTQQIEAGAPFDVFLSADVTHVDELAAKGLTLGASKEIYATGRLAVYAPNHPSLRSLNDLVQPKPMEIFIAKPELAPYGIAAVQAMKKAGIWGKMESHTKYAPNIAAAKQYADTGNCDAAFTALSLVSEQKSGYFVVDPSLHSPINQALCILKASKQAEMAKVYTSFLGSAQAGKIWKKFGYGK